MNNTIPNDGVTLPYFITTGVERTMRLNDQPTIRQYYKAAAITGLAANAVYNDASYPEMAMVAGVIADALLAEDSSPHHIVGDLREVMNDARWDFYGMHPECTYVCGSGIHWNDRGRGWEKTEQAVALARWMMDRRTPYYLENPVGILSSRIRKPDQIIQPYEFGEDASKKTCLWLNGITPLRPTGRFAGRMVEQNGKRVERWSNQTDSGQNKLPPSDLRWKERSRTYAGIANAMAEQWGFWGFCDLCTGTGEGEETSTCPACAGTGENVPYPKTKYSLDNRGELNIMNISITPENIDQLVTDAILKSGLGKQIETVLKSVTMTNGYNREGIIENAIKQALCDTARKILTESPYKEQLDEAVKVAVAKVIQSDVVDKFTGEFISKLSRDW